MRLLPKRRRLRPLDERECYLRLHGVRSGEVEVVRAPRTPPRPQPRGVAGGEPLGPGPEGDPRGPGSAPRRGGSEEARGSPGGPTDGEPALHLLIAYPRNGARLTGDEVRRELLRRMEARTGEAA